MFNMKCHRFFEFSQTKGFIFLIFFQSFFFVLRITNLVLLLASVNIHLSCLLLCSFQLLIKALPSGCALSVRGDEISLSYITITTVLLVEKREHEVLLILFGGFIVFNFFVFMKSESTINIQVSFCFVPYL